MSTTTNPVTGRPNDASLDPAGSTYSTGSASATRQSSPSTPPPYGESVSSDRIKNDIRETRSEMDETVDALADRLKPRHLLDDVLDYFTGRSGGETRATRESTGSADLRGAAGSAASSAASFTAEKGTDLAKGIGSTLYKSVRRHPLPAALIGAGVAWMLFEDDNDKVLKAQAKYRNYQDEPEMYSGSYVDARTGRPYDRDTYGQEYRGGSRGDFGGREGYGSTGQATGARYGSTFAGGSTGSGAGGYSAGGYGDVDPNSVTIDERDPNAPGYAERAKEAARQATERLKGSARDSAGKLRDTTGNLIDGAGNLLDSAGNAITSAASSVGSAVSSAASSVGSAFSSAGSATADYANRGGRYASERSRQGYAASKQYGQKGYVYSRDRFESGLQEYPVGMGVAALAAGLLAGLLIPRTRLEDDYFGETSDHLKDQATELGQHAYEEGKHVFQATYDAALEEARKQGLTPDQMKAQAKRLADAAVAEAQERGFTPDKLVDKAKQFAGDATQSVKSAAAGAASTAKDAAQKTADRSGTDSPSSLVDKVKAVVNTATETARHEAEDAKDHLTAEASGKADDAANTVKSAAQNAADAASKKV